VRANDRVRNFPRGPVEVSQHEACMAGGKAWFEHVNPAPAMPGAAHSLETIQRLVAVTLDQFTRFGTTELQRATEDLEIIASPPRPAAGTGDQFLANDLIKSSLGAHPELYECTDVLAWCGHHELQAERALVINAH